MYEPQASVWDRLESELAIGLYVEKWKLERGRLTGLLHEVEEHQMTSPLINRMRNKLLQARGVAQRVASDIESEADSLIAEEDAFKKHTSEAFAPHKEILGEAKSELNAIKDALSLMSNGGPPLDPLHVAEPTAAGSMTSHALPDPAMDQQGKK